MDLYRLTPNNRKRYNWPTIIENQKESGLTIRRYCHEHGISECLFYRNKARLSECDSGDSRDSQTLFVPAVLVDRPDEELTFMIDGHEISCSEEMLRRIVKAL